MSLAESQDQGHSLHHYTLHRSPGRGKDSMQCACGARARHTRAPKASTWKCHHLSRLMAKANHITMPDFPGGMCAQRVGIFKDYPDPLSPEIPALCSIHPVYEVHQVFEQSPVELHPRLGRGHLAMDSSPAPSVRRTSTHTWSPLSALCP